MFFKNSDACVARPVNEVVRPALRELLLSLALDGDVRQNVATP